MPPNRRFLADTLGYPLLALAAIAICYPIDAGAVELQFGSLRIDWPEGYTIPSSKPPFEFIGPSGEKILVTVMRPGKEIPFESSSSEQEKMATVGEGLLRRQSEKIGKVTLPIGRAMLPGGNLLLFMGSENSALFSAGYFLQYLIVSPTGRLAFFTAEGKGGVDEHHRRYLPLFNTITWSP